MSAQVSQKPTVACLVVTYNRDDFIETCVSSLLAARSDTLDVSVTVFNNGSPDTTRDVLDRLAAETGISVVHKDSNTRLALVMNETLEVGHASGADYLLLLNDDIEMRPGAIAEMVGVETEVPGALITPMQIDYRNPEHLDAGMLERVRASSELVTDAVYHRKIKRHYRQDTLIGAALLARAETFARIGDFDPLFAFYGLDDDYCTRAKALDVPLLVATGAEMLHMHGKTTETSQAPDKAAWMRRWSTMYRARVLFRLKAADRPLPLAYLGAGARMLGDIPKFLLQRFPRGSVVAARTLVDLCAAYGDVRRRRGVERRLMLAGKK